MKILSFGIWNLEFQIVFRTCQSSGSLSLSLSLLARHRATWWCSVVAESLKSPSDLNSSRGILLSWVIFPPHHHPTSCHRLSSSLLISASIADWILKMEWWVLRLSLLVFKFEAVGCTLSLTVCVRVGYVCRCYRWFLRWVLIFSCLISDCWFRLVA